MSKNLLVVRLRGTVNVREPVKRTLEQLHLTKRFRATIIPDTPDYRGMLISSKEYVAWCPVDASLISKLIKKRGRKGGWAPLTLKDIKGWGFKGFSGMARSIDVGKTALKEIEGMNPFFALSPPRGGFKRSTRRLYTQGGILGENPELISIVGKMI
ncbi:MAG: 50S ribosomal protein L30 [Candidatus Methylarchaceae archaeon HK01B]|nr:50S ribosomal protein L30 [Candidatus Methylarchaceae archaeon HK01M]MCP8312223.1 50S ribosomal protein L30 [Candidatus Methylarchaceae archaeon HK02M1]MCP8318742.1 50S ribosomal protein L30 [Candidatus Methylarchaceae archaeon HK01B]